MTKTASIATAIMLAIPAMLYSDVWGNEPHNDIPICNDVAELERLGMKHGGTINKIDGQDFAIYVTNAARSHNQLARVFASYAMDPRYDVRYILAFTFQDHVAVHLIDRYDCSIFVMGADPRIHLMLQQGHSKIKA